jgi:hypothetical protein
MICTELPTAASSPNTTSNATQATTASSKTLDDLLDSTGEPFTAALNRLTGTVTITQGDFMASIPLSDPFLAGLLARKATTRKVWA